MSTTSPSPTYRGQLETRTGAEVFDLLGPELDDLHDATGTPLTARRVWLRAWNDAYPSSEPWAFVVRDPGSGRIDAAALLSRRRLSHGFDVSPLGFGRNDRSRLPARDGAAAQALAAGISAGLAGLGTPWTLRVEQLPAGDAAAAALVDHLDVATILRGGDVPCVEFSPSVEPALDAYISKALRKVLRKSRNRIEADGHEMTIAFESSPRGVLALVDEVERVHRERDHAVGRDSDLDSDYGVRFWRNVITGHAVRSKVEIATLRLDGLLAAYVVSFLDADSYRVFDGRFATEWARYSPGRLLETATLERAIQDGRYQRLDWMNSVAPDKLICANTVEETVHLVACSPDRVLDLRREPGEVVLESHADRQPTADAALLALSGVGRAAPRRTGAGDAAPSVPQRRLQPQED